MTVLPFPLTLMLSFLLAAGGVWAEDQSPARKPDAPDAMEGRTMAEAFAEKFSRITADEGVPFAGKAAPPEGGLTLWYRQPARAWEEALPVGNGRLGAMVFGQVRGERIQLNEETVWDGYPRDTTNPKALEALPEMRRLLFAGKNEEATQLARATMLAVPERIHSYQSLGDLRLILPGHAKIADYRRTLDLDTGIASVSYLAGEIRHVREVFASAPAQVIAVRLTADRPASVSFEAAFTR